MSARIGAAVRSFAAAFVAAFFSLAAVAQIGVGGPLLGSQPAGSISAGAFPLKAPVGTAGAPSYSWAVDPTSGFWRWAASATAYSAAGSSVIGFSTASVRLSSTTSLNWSSGDPTVSGGDVFITRFATKQIAITGDGTGTSSTNTGWILGNVSTTLSGIWHSALTPPTLSNAAVLSDTNGQTFFNAPTGQTVNLSINQSPKLSVTAALTTTVPPLLISTGATANQVRTAQTTPPTCTTNCGTPGNACIGTDTSMICTMGTTPASGVLITFNGTWAAAPSCVVQMALAGMVVGKQILTAVTTTTTITLVTNGTAPSTSDKYAIHCIGVQ